MAEGQIVVWWARQFQPLLDQPLEMVQLTKRWTEQARELVGQCVTRFETRGKHMLLHFSGGMVLHCHAMMFGSWQIGERGMEPRKPAARVRVRLATATHEAIFYSGPVVELLTPEELAGHERLNQLGPDIMATPLDREEIWRRAQRNPRRQIAEVLLDQTVVAGIGNIFKSEGLFLAGIDPRRTVEALSREEFERVLEVTAEIMHKSLAEQARIQTVPEYWKQANERRWVYQRGSRPCLNCGAMIRSFQQGLSQRRRTFYCPTCQR